MPLESERDTLQAENIRLKSLLSEYEARSGLGLASELAGSEETSGLEAVDAELPWGQGGLSDYDTYMM